MPQARRQSLQHRKVQSATSRRQSLCAASCHQFQASYKEPEKVTNLLGDEPRESEDSFVTGSEEDARVAPEVLVQQNSRRHLFASYSRLSRRHFEGTGSRERRGSSARLAHAAGGDSEGTGQRVRRGSSARITHASAGELEGTGPRESRGSSARSNQDVTGDLDPQERRGGPARTNQDATGDLKRSSPRERRGSSARVNHVPGADADSLDSSQAGGSRQSLDSSRHGGSFRTKKERPRIKQERSMGTPPHPSQFGVIPGLLMGDLWSDEGKIVFEAIRDLANIAGVDDDCVEDREVINELGGPCTIIATMTKWHRSIVITIDGLRALANLGANSDFRDTSFNCGGLEVTLTAMKNYPDDMYVQRNGCAVICRFCCNMDLNSVEFVEEYNGLSYLVHALRAFPHNTALQEFVITIMYCFSTIERLRYTILESGIAEPLTRVADMLEGREDRRETWMKARVVLNAITDY